MDELLAEADQVRAIAGRLRPDPDSRDPRAISLREACGYLDAAVRWIEDAAEQAGERGQ